jgi:hypothetical protein
MSLHDSYWDIVRLSSDVEGTPVHSVVYNNSISYSGHEGICFVNVTNFEARNNIIIQLEPIAESGQRTRILLPYMTMLLAIHWPEIQAVMPVFYLKIKPGLWSMLKYLTMLYTARMAESMLEEMLERIPPVI